MAKRLTAKSIKYAMMQLDKGKGVTEVAKDIGVTPRHVRRLRAKYRAVGTPPSHNVPADQHGLHLQGRHV